MGIFVYIHSGCFQAINTSHIISMSVNCYDSFKKTIQEPLPTKSVKHQVIIQTTNGETKLQCKDMETADLCFNEIVKSFASSSVIFSMDPDWYPVEETPEPAVDPRDV